MFAGVLAVGFNALFTPHGLIEGEPSLAAEPQTKGTDKVFAVDSRNQLEIRGVARDVSAPVLGPVTMVARAAESGGLSTADLMFLWMAQNNCSCGHSMSSV